MGHLLLQGISLGNKLRRNAAGTESYFRTLRACEKRVDNNLGVTILLNHNFTFPTDEGDNIDIDFVDNRHCLGYETNFFLSTRLSNKNSS